MIAFITQNFVPLMFCGLLFFLLTGIPVAFGLAATGLLFGFIGMEAGAVPDQPVRRAAAAGVRHHEERHAAGDPVLHLHGHHPRTLRHGRGPARDRRPGLRPGARRPGDRGDPGRRAAGRDHRRRRRGGDLDGPDLAADHAAQRLQPHHRHRHHHRLGHAGAGDPAVAGADRAGRPARPLGRRHVRRRADPGPAAGRPVHPVRRRRGPRAAEVGAAAAARGAHLPRSQWRQRPRLAGRAAGHLRRRRLRLEPGAREHHESVARARDPGAGRRDLHHVDDGGVVPGAGAGRRQPPRQGRSAVQAGRARDLRADPAAGADLPRAGHDLPRRRHADRRRRDGRAGRADHGHRPRQADA